MIKLRCDWPGCHARIETHNSKITEARKSASAHGWRAAGGLDLCGSRDQAEEYTDDYTLSMLRGHAAREDHAPVIEPARKGYVKLSCRCGWAVPAEHSWDRAGECARSTADMRWGKHVKAAEREVEPTDTATPPGGEG
jgi:hypothetical protein